MLVKKNSVTVSELAKQLEVLKELGYGDFELWYRPYDAPDYKLEEGIWDVSRDCKSITLA